MRDKFIKFMYGRYGMDLMGKDMLVLALLFSLIGMVLNLFRVGWYSLPFSVLSLLLLIFVIYRTFSRNINKRVMENHRYYSTDLRRIFFPFRVKHVGNQAVVMLLKTVYTVLWSLTIVGGLIALGILPLANT